MAIYRYLRTGGKNVVLFAESSPGVFGNVVSSNTNTMVRTSGNTMVVVAAGLGSDIVASWYNTSGATVSPSNVLTCTASNSAATYPYTTYTALLGSLTVIDSHGTHVGTPVCSGVKYWRSGNPGAIGVKHTSTNSGYTFSGWKITCDGSSTTTSSDTLVRWNLTYSTVVVEALYTKNTYTIAFNLNGGDGSVESIEVDTGSSATIPTDIPTRDGYRFLYWNTASSGSGTSYTLGEAFTPTGNMTLFAIWAEVSVDTFTVSFDLNGGTGDAPSISVEDGDSITIPDYSPTKDGYTFLGWSLNQESTSAEYTSGDQITPSGNITLYAIWKQNEEGGGGSPDTNTGMLAMSSTSDFLVFSLVTGALVYD